VVCGRPGARGEDGKLQPMDVRTGRPGSVRQMVGHRVKLDGRELIIMKESDIMGVIGSIRETKSGS